MLKYTERSTSKMTDENRAYIKAVAEVEWYVMLKKLHL